MSKSQSNLIIDGASGRLGRDLVVRHLPDGRTLLCARPDFSRRVFSPQQQTHQQRFREASAYASVAAAREPLYAQLAAGTMKTPYNIALSDWFHPPVIHRIEVCGPLIRTCATDNVRVAQVLVTLADANGLVLEQGTAAQVNGLWWEYTPTAPLHPGQRITATARDLAGNTHTQVLTL